MSNNTLDKLRQTNSNFKNIISPLTEIFKISFGYMIVFKNSQYYSIIDDLECLLQFTTHVKKSIIFCERNVTNYFDGEYNFTLWPEKASFPAMEIFKQYNIWNGITISKIQNNYTELYWFNADKDKKNWSKFFIRNKNLLMEFINYFDTFKETLFIPTSSDQKTLFRFSEGFDSNIAKHSEYLKTESQLIKNFFNRMNQDSLSVGARTYNNADLSIREIEVLLMIGRGYTAKGAAKKLDISVKTVQNHIDHIKQKTGTHHRMELIQFYENYFYNNKKISA